MEKDHIERREWYEATERSVFPEDSNVFSRSPRKVVIEAKQQKEYPKADPAFLKNRNRLLVELNKVDSHCYSFVFCFPGAGNSHSYFKHWGSKLAEKNIKLYGICLRGRMHRIHEDTSERNFINLAKELFLSIRSLLVWHKASDILTYKDMPTPNLVLFGHDLGAYLAFETARLLQCNGLADMFRVQLIVSAAENPNWHAEVNMRRREREAVKYIDPYDTRINGEELERVSNKPWKELLAYLLLHDHIPQELANSKDLLKYLLPLVRVDYLLLESYELKQPDLDDFDFNGEDKSEDPTYILLPKTTRLGVNISVIYAKDDGALRIEQMEGWIECTSASCDLMQPFETGGRNYLTNEEHQEVLMEIFDSLNYA